MRIYSQDIGMEFGIKMYHNEKRKTTNDGTNRTIKSRKNRTLGEKETFEYLGILDANTIKQAEMEKSISEEEKTTPNKSIWQKPHQRNKNLVCPLCKIFGTILKMDKGRTSTNEPENRKTKDEA